MDQPSERVAVVATVDPVNGNNAANSSDYVDMSKFASAMFILLAGAMDSTLDFKLVEATDSGGTGAQDLSAKAITQETGGDDDNRQWIINVKAEELSAGFTHVKAVATCGNGTTNLIAVVGLGLDPKYGPASDNDLATVDQIVT